MKYALLFIPLLFLCMCSPSPPAPPYAVKHKGTLKDIMHEGDISAKADLDNFKSTPHLYALGPLENLQGEILILDGVPYISTVQNAELNIGSAYTHKAALLVYSTVENWLSIKIPKEIVTYQELEIFIEKMATENGIDTEIAFPFLLEGAAKYIDWHVVRWNVADTEHTHEKHIHSGPHGQISFRDVEVLGFYSKHHHAIFTHHMTNMHMHFRTKDGVVAAHLDDITVGSRMTLKLPKTS